MNLLNEGQRIPRTSSVWLRFGLIYTSQCLETSDIEMDVLKGWVEFKPGLHRKLLNRNEYIRRVYISTSGSVDGMSSTAQILTGTNNVKLIRASKSDMQELNDTNK